MVQDFLELGGSFRALVRGQIGLAAHIDRIQGPVGPKKAALRRAQLIRSGGSQEFDGFCGRAVLQCEKCAKRRYITESDRRILREAPFQVSREGLSPGRTPGEGQSKGDAILYVPVL